MFLAIACYIRSLSPSACSNSNRIMSLVPSKACLCIHYEFLHTVYSECKAVRDDYQLGKDATCLTFYGCPAATSRRSRALRV